VVRLNAQAEAWAYLRSKNNSKSNDKQKQIPPLRCGMINKKQWQRAKVNGKGKGKQATAKTKYGDSGL
jgi:hypothetical protein